MAQTKLGGGRNRGGGEVEKREKKKSKRLGRREKLAQKVGRREKLAQKVGRREIYPLFLPSPPTPPPPPLKEHSSGILSYFDHRQTVTVKLKET